MWDGFPILDVGLGLLENERKRTPGTLGCQLHDTRPYTNNLMPVPVMNVRVVGVRMDQWLMPM